MTRKTSAEIVAGFKAAFDDMLDLRPFGPASDAVLLADWLLAAIEVFRARHSDNEAELKEAEEAKVRARRLLPAGYSTSSAANRVMGLLGNILEGDRTGVQADQIALAQIQTFLIELRPSMRPV